MRTFIEMGTLEGSPSPPAMVRSRQSRLAPHANAPRTCLLGLTAVLFLSAACGQNEGGRCQITSDCASGLECKEVTSGNGTCRRKGSTTIQTSDAALGKDVAGDLPVVPETEVGPDAVATPEIDAGAVDSDGVDSTAID